MSDVARAIAEAVVEAVPGIDADDAATIAVDIETRLLAAGCELRVKPNVGR